MSWYARHDDRWVIDVHVQPGARSSAVTGLHGERLKLRVQAPPQEGKANDAVIDLIAKRLAIARRNVRIVAGASSRDKRIEITDPAADPAQLLDQPS